MTPRSGPFRAGDHEGIGKGVFLSVHDFPGDRSRLYCRSRVTPRVSLGETSIEGPPHSFPKVSRGHRAQGDGSPGDDRHGKEPLSDAGAAPGSDSGASPDQSLGDGFSGDGITDLPFKTVGAEQIEFLPSFPSPL